MLTRPPKFDDLEFESTPESLLVGLALNGRIVDDLRAIQHLSSMGYCEQSCTVAASVFEVAHTAVFNRAPFRRL